MFTAIRSCVVTIIRGWDLDPRAWGRWRWFRVVAWWTILAVGYEVQVQIKAASGGLPLSEWVDDRSRPTEGR